MTRRAAAAAAAGAQKVQLRDVVRGSETVLADAAAADEVFLSDTYQTRCACRPHMYTKL